MTGDPRKAQEQAEVAELARRAAQFPSHHISREITCDRIRYVASSCDLKTSSYAVITDNLDELFAELAVAQPPARPRQIPEPLTNSGGSGRGIAP